jgi:hypothetical protein
MMSRGTFGRSSNKTPWHLSIWESSKVTTDPVFQFYFKWTQRDCLIKELGIDNSLCNPTYTPTTLTKEEILENHRSVLCSFGISTKDEKLDLPSLYWIPKLHKCPFKQRYIAGSAKCSTKFLSNLLTCILSVVKTGLQRYCEVVWIGCGFWRTRKIC